MLLQVPQNIECPTLIGGATGVRPSWSGTLKLTSFLARAGSIDRAGITLVSPNPYRHAKICVMGGIRCTPNGKPLESRHRFLAVFRPFAAATMGRKPAFLRGFLFWPKTAKCERGRRDLDRKGSLKNWAPARTDSSRDPLLTMERRGQLVATDGFALDCDRLQPRGSIKAPRGAEVVEHNRPALEVYGGDFRRRCRALAGRAEG